MTAEAVGLHGRRRALVWTLIVLASLLAFVSSLTVWTKRELLDTNAWTSSASELLANDQVRSALAVKLDQALYERVDLTAAVRQQLPPSAQSAAPVIAAALENASGRAIETFLSTAAAQRLWTQANRTAHATLIKVLEGQDVGPLATSNGNVVLNLRPIVGKLATRLGFADTLRTRTSASADQIVLLKSDDLGKAQAAVKTLKVLSVLLAFVVLVLYGLAVYLARGVRRHTLQVVGGSLLVVGLLLLVTRRIVGHVLVDSLVTTDANRPAATTAWLIATDLLKDIAVGLVVYGLAAVAAGALAGPSRAAVWIRRQLAPWFARGPVWVHGAGVVIVLIVLAWGPTAGARRLIGTLVLTALFFLGLEVYRRLTLREFGPPKPVPPAAKGAAPALGS
jgi:hypothetical protein